eukprot:g20319.t1
MSDLSALHIAIGNEPDRSGVHADRVLDVLKALKAEIPEAQVTVPFAYSIMHRSHPVEKSKLEKEFVDEYKHVLPLLDYFTINIYPFLSSGTKGVAMSNLTGPEMNFLNDQISALRIALDRDFPHNNLPLAIGALIPGDFLPVEGHMVYGKRTAQTKCWSQRLADKYSDRGAVNKPNVSHLTDQHAKEAPSSKSTSQSSEVNPLPDRFVGEGVEPSVVTRPRTLPVYWINLEQSKDRRVAMENMFASVSLRPSAKLIDACEDACPEHHSRGELLYTEMACSLSHLRAMEYALAGNASLALIMEDRFCLPARQDDIEIYPEFGTDLERLLTDAPTGWSALQMSSVSTKGILQLASAGAVFQPRERQFYGTGSYIINRFGMLHLRAQYAAMQFQRKSWLPGAGSLQGVIYDALPEGSVHTSTHFYFNVIDFPTTVHIMSNSSEWYAVSSVAWQRNFVHRHRGRLLPATPTSTIPERLVRSSFLAMTTLVCRNNTGFDGESRSIAASIRAMAPYNFSWAVYVIVSDGSEEGKCPGLESFRELRQPNVRMLYRPSLRLPR